MSKHEILLYRFALKNMVWKQGLSVCSVTIDGKKHLVAFGGYNGNYSNEVC